MSDQPIKLLAALALVVGAGCAHPNNPNYDPMACTKQGGYDKGYNDGRAGKPMNSKFARYCAKGDEVAEGYRQGYESATGGTTTKPTPKPKPKPMININIGGGSKPSKPEPNPKAYFCSTKQFFDTYEGFGPTELEARQAAMKKCLDDRRFRSSCERDMKCQMNR